MPMNMLSVGLALVSCAAIFGFSAAEASKMPSGAAEEIRRVESRIDRIEAETMARMQNEHSGQFQKVGVLGKLLVFDRQLSVDRNEACAFCHMRDTGCTGRVSSLNATTVAYPGSIRTRFSSRKPQSHTYATFAPVLHYNQAQGDFVGGAFWDMRATGTRLNNPVPDQAQGPPLNPVEMGFIDSACLVYRASRRPYRPLAEQVWGPQPFPFHWPSHVEQVCAQPGPAVASDPFPVHLNAIDRGTANRTFDQFAEAVAAYEASSEVNPFSSKYDAVLAGKAKFTPDEKAGNDLFRSAATHCNECHRDGGPGAEPLFTDFTARNLSGPANSTMPIYSDT